MSSLVLPDWSTSAEAAVATTVAFTGGVTAGFASPVQVVPMSTSASNAGPGDASLSNVPVDMGDAAGAYDVLAAAAVAAAAALAASAPAASASTVPDDENMTAGMHTHAPTA